MPPPYSSPEEPPAQTPPNFVSLTSPLVCWGTPWPRLPTQLIRHHLSNTLTAWLSEPRGRLARASLLREGEIYPVACHTLHWPVDRGRKPQTVDQSSIYSRGQGSESSLPVPGCCWSDHLATAKMSGRLAPALLCLCTSPTSAG